MDLPSFEQTQPVTQQFPSFEQTQDVPEENVLNQAKAGLEGFERGATLGLSDWARTHVDPLLTGESPEKIQSELVSRKEQYPITSEVGNAVGQVAPLIATEGASSALGVTGAIKALPSAAKIGANAVKGYLELGLLSGGDEISKAMLGQSDPEHPVASALSHMNAAGLFGAVTGGAFSGLGVGLAKLAETKTASKMAQFAEDFGKRWKFLEENPDMASSLKGELQDFHTSTNSAADEVYGSGGLKDQAIKKLVPKEISKEIANQANDINNALQFKMNEMIKDPDTYPARFVKTFQKDANNWMETATSPNASSYDIFNATQDLKQKLQYYAKFDKQINPFAQERGFVNASKDIAYQLRAALEDQKAWGDAAKLQQGINKAFTEFHPALKDFNSKFTTKVEGDSVIDPGKINTYVNQLGKPNAEIKQGMLKSYIDAAEKYRGKIADLYHNLGLENPLPPSSLVATKETLGQKTAGGSFADYLKFKMPGKIGPVVGEGAGAAIAGLPGLFIAKELGPWLEKAVGRPLSDLGGNAAVKVLSSGGYDGTAEALQHANNVERGAKKIKIALDSLFKSGGAQAIQNYSLEKDKEKIKKFIEKGGVTKQIQNQLQHDSKNKPQNFAKGGYVEKLVEPNVSGESSSKLASVYPDQDMLLQEAKGRVFNYLNSVKPQKNQSKLPFDHEPDRKASEKNYDGAVELAAHPLGILNKVKSGSLTIQDMKHFTQMYPEIYNQLGKQMTKRISEAQSEDTRPDYKTRQGLSLFLGAPMDSTFTPQNIQAAQSVFAQQRAAKQAAIQAQSKAKKGTNKLDKASNPYQTRDQAAQARQSQ